jgi:hypothetical protein
MGYSYGRTKSGSMALACDNCGNVGGVRKRPCRYKVTMNGRAPLPYGPAPAVCADCFKRLGGTRGLHGEDCRKGAEWAQAKDDAEVARLKAGDYIVRSAAGSWHKDVPAGQVLVMFEASDGTVLNKFMPAETYRNGGWLSDYPEAIPAPEGIRI